MLSELSLAYRFKDFCQLAVRSAVSGPGQSELLGRFCYEASTAIVMQEQPVLSFADVTTACNSNNLNFSAWIPPHYCVNMLNEEEVGLYQNVLL